MTDIKENKFDNHLNSLKSNRKANFEYPEIPEILDYRIKDEIGRVISAINDPVYIGLYDDPRIKAAIESHKSIKIRLGDYLLIYDFIRGQTMAVRVIGHSTQTIDENRTSDHLYKLDAPSGYEQFKNKRFDFLRTPHIVHLEPVKLVKLEENSIETVGSVDFAPSESAAVFEPEDDEIRGIIGLKDEGLRFGVLARENELQTFLSSKSLDEYLIPIRISREILTRHVSINGSTGSGKTVVIKNLIYELAKQNSTVLITDTQGDFVSQLYRDTLTKRQLDELNKNEYHTNLISSALEINYDEIGITKDRIQVFYPPFMEEDEFLQDLRRNGIAVLPLQLTSSLISNWATLATVMPNLNETQYQGLELIFRRYLEYLKERELRDFWLEEFIQWIGRTIEGLQEEYGIHTGTMRVILRNLQLLQYKKILDRTKEHTKYHELMKEGNITILYLPSDNVEVLSARPLIQLLVYSLIQRHRSETTTQRVIIIDEAQEIIPHEREAPSKTVARELAKQFQLLAQQGRKFGMGIVVASQEPKRINRTVFSQCSTRIFLKLTSKDIEYLKFEIPSEFKEAIVRLKAGSGLIVSPEEIEVGQVWIRFPMPPIYHEKPSLTKSKILKEFGPAKIESRPEESKAQPLEEDED